MRIIVRLLSLIALWAISANAQQSSPILPDSRLTPGDTFDVSGQDVCVVGYTKRVRAVPQEIKEEVYREYGITSHGRGEYEIDHLIPLELGGSNSIKNLWPESYSVCLTPHQKWSLNQSLLDRAARDTSGLHSLPLLAGEAGNGFCFLVFDLVGRDRFQCERDS
jgi:hypothetical protein